METIGHVIRDGRRYTTIDRRCDRIADVLTYVQWLEYTCGHVVWIEWE